MGKPAVTKEEIQQIVFLRQTGHSLPEICRKVGRSNSAVFKYIQGVDVRPEFVPLLKMKQGGSKKRSDLAWSEARIEARHILNTPLSERERLMLLLGLYWGEGTKQEFNVMNSDPGLIKTILECILSIGIQKKDIQVSLRIHEEVNRKEAIRFWTTLLEINIDKVTRIEIIEGKKKGKLKYGMCRLRVAKAGRYFKLVMSLIEEIKLQFNAPVVKRI